MNIKKLHSLLRFVRTTLRTKTANITKDDVTCASHRPNVTVATICMFMQNFVEIGWTIAELLEICDFQYGGGPPSWIFRILKFQFQALYAAAICMLMQNFVAIGRTVAKLLQSKNFQYVGCPPSRICSGCTPARDHAESVIGGLYHCTKFVLNRFNTKHWQYQV